MTRFRLLRSRRSLAVVAVLSATVLVLTPATAGADFLPAPPQAPPLPAVCNTLTPRNPPGQPAGYGLPAHNYITGGVLTDGFTSGTNLNASTCGLFVLPQWPQTDDPLDPGQASTDPNGTPQNTATIPPDQISFGTGTLNLALGTLLPGLPAVSIGTLSVHASTMAKAWVRKQPTANGAINVDLITTLTSTINVNGLLTCSIGSKDDPAVTTGPDPGVDPVTAEFTTATVNAPPGGTPAAPVTGRLDNGSAVVNALPFTLQVGGCKALGGIPASVLETVLNSPLSLPPDGARFSAPFTLQLSLT